MSNPLLAMLNASAMRSSQAPEAAGSPQEPSQNTASAGDLLARLTSPPATSGRDGQKSLSNNDGVPAGDNASDLLRALLSPRDPSFPQPKVPLQPSDDGDQVSNAASSMQSQTSMSVNAASLLAQLSLGASAPPASSPSQAGTPVITGRSPDGELVASLGSGSASIPSKAASPTQSSKSPLPPKPITSPPLHRSLPAARQSKARPPVPTIFDFASPFDLLSQEHQAETRQDAVPIDLAAKSSREAVTSAQTPTRMEQTQASGPQKRGDDRAPTVAPETDIAVTAYEQDRNRHARRHLVGLRASSGFDDDISSGLTQKTRSDGITELTVDLLAPQPAGCHTLYAAKLESEQISQISSPFAPPRVITDASLPNAKQWPCQVVGALGESVIAYSMTKGRIRVIDKISGERAMLKIGKARPAIFCGRTKRVINGREHWSIGAISGTNLAIWDVSSEFSKSGVSPSLVADYTAPSDAPVVQASFLPNTGDDLVLLTQANGCISTLNLQRSKAEPGKASKLSAGDMTVSKDLGRLLEFATHDLQGETLIYATKSERKSGDLTLTLVALGGARQTVNCEVECSAIVKGQARVDSMYHLGANLLILGINDNTHVLIIDLAARKISQAISFSARGKEHFLQAAFDDATATLVLASSLRSSVFTVRPLTYSDSVGTGDFVSLLHSLDSPTQPIDLLSAMKECTLDEPWISLAVGSDRSGGLRAVAVTATGSNVTNLAAEAIVSRPLRQNIESTFEPGYKSPSHIAEEDSANKAPANVDSIKSVLDGTAASTIIDVDADENTHDGGQKVESMADFAANTESGSGIAPPSLVPALLAAMERNIIDAINAREEEAPNSTTIETQDLTQAIIDRLEPSLKASLHEIVDKSMASSLLNAVEKSLPRQIGQILSRADVSSQLARSVSASIVQPIQRTAMDVVSKAMAPHFEQVMSDLALRVEQKIESGITGVRKDIVAEQSKALVETQSRVTELSQQLQQIQGMTESLLRQNTKLESITNDVRTEQRANAFDFRQSSFAPEKPQSYAQGYLSLNPASMPHSRQASQAHGFFNGSAGTSTPQHQQMPPALPASHDVEGALLEALSSSSLHVDSSGLRAALSRLELAHGSPRSAMWEAQDKLRVSQAVVLTLLHRLVKSLNQPSGSPGEMQPEQAVPWIEACCLALDRNDGTVMPYLVRLQRELIDGLYTAQRKFAMSGRSLWWTQERLQAGALQYFP